MEDLSRKDLLALLSAIETLHAENDPLTMPERTLRAVMSLIPNEITSFDAFDDDSHYDGYLRYSPAGTVSEERVEILGELVGGHPMFSEVMGKGRRRRRRFRGICRSPNFRRPRFITNFTSASAAIRR